MNLSGPFIRRPIATSLLAIAILLAGGAAFSVLPVAPLPRVDQPTISVSSSLPGASPTTMATSVAMPLERRFGRIAGVTEITSSSGLGTTSVTVQFDLNRNVEGAARDIQAAINAAGGDLPANLPTRPTYRKVNSADSPILIISLRSKSIPLSQVFEDANTVLAQKLSQVPGVGQVGVGGGVQPAVRVQYDPAVLAGLGIGSSDVRNALSTATSNQPKGGVGDVQWQAIQVDDQLLNADQWKKQIIHYVPQTGSQVGTDGSVRLGDVADVTDDVENRRVAGWYDGERTVMLIIRRQPDANILEVIDRVKTLMPSLMKTIHPGIDMSYAIDRAQSIRASVHDVERTLLISIMLVVLVVFVFLRSGRATIIPSVAVPLSLVGTFGLMYLCGFSLDNLSLMALTIATGFVVDDAIVVTENVSRHIENGSPPVKAALDGSREIGFTIVSITCSLLAVFIPLLFMGGVVGRLFREFAVTLVFAVGISALLSLTLTPMMCARMLKSHHETKPGRIGRAADAGLDWIIQTYGRLLKRVLRHKWAVGMFTLGTMAMVAVLIATIPLGLFPQQDTGMLAGSSRAPQDISFPAMKERQEALNKILASDPDIDHFVSFVGGFGSGTANQGSFFVSLKPLGERSGSADEIINKLRPKLSRVEGIQLFMQAVQDVRIGGRSSRAQYQFTLEDANLDELNEWGPRVEKALQKVPLLKDVNSDQQTDGLQLSLTIDRDTAARFGITAANIDDALYDAFGQRQVATFYTQVNQYRVVLEASPSIGLGPDALGRIFVPSSTGQQVPLTELVTSVEKTVPLSIAHQGQFPATTISFNLAPGVALGQATEAVEQATASIGLPGSVQTNFAGTAQAFQDSLKSEKWLIAIALIAVYIVLGVLYESYVHPITILTTIIPAGLGALLALHIAGSDLNLIAIIGLILLIGIVKKNAILMIDFAIEQEREGKPPDEAIFQACLLRFRPILMTTLAALLGALPLALGTGMGSELRRPLGIAIVGGLIVSQLLTLFTTPCTYLILHGLTRKRPAPDQRVGNL
ncbi:MAG TPA: multidrug efflux RND transporter permease subunit [Kofleriaceae bacterium]